MKLYTIAARNNCYLESCEYERYKNNTSGSNIYIASIYHFLSKNISKYNYHDIFNVKLQYAFFVSCSFMNKWEYSVFQLLKKYNTKKGFVIYSINIIMRINTI